MIRPAPRRPPCPLLLLSLALAATGAASAQSTRVGPIVGYEYGVPLLVDRTAGIINRYDFDGDGTSSNHTLWFGASASFADALPGATVAPRLSLALSTGLFESEPFLLRDTEGPQVRLYDIRFDVYSSLSVAQFDLPLFFDVGGDASLGLGPWASYRISSGFSQTEYVVDATGVTFRNGSTSRAVDAGNDVGGARVHYGALACGAIDVPIGDGIVLRPEFFARIDAAGLLVDTLGLRAITAGFCLSTMLALPSTLDSPRELVTATDVAAVADRPIADEPDSLHASIELSLDGDAPLEVAGTLEQLEIPLSVTAAFESGSERLPDALASMTRERAAQLSIDSLTRLDAIHLQRRSIDVVALRMREHPSATVTIIGARIDTEAPSLARARAHAIRRYLADVWAIDSMRVRIAEPVVGDETHIVTSKEIASPIVMRWITRSYRAPRVGLRHSMDASDGVRYWEIVLRQGERVVARTDDAMGDSLLSGAISLNGIALPLVGELAIIDSLGNRFVARDTLHLSNRARQAVLARERREVIIGPDEDLMARARTIAATTNNGAAVTIGRLGGGEAVSRTPARFAALILSALEKRGVALSELRVEPDRANASPGSATPLAGALRVVVEQPYAERDN